ncbi:toxin glutamine deamidase domain-containing protein [Microbispora siamensis]|uniref:toxin glutamine deamidase domain-containing protein n=1 Tax=Microbispora siamensis TaxID=564413 RepID=UPI001EF2AD72|nr:toxin glutamine deamidase domain-containing protein [Microbispora siamensis]
MTADGRRWRDYEQAAEAPAPSLEDRRLEVRLAALPLGVDTVTMPVVPAARNGESGGRGGHGLAAPIGRRAGSPDAREAVPAVAPADAGNTGDIGDRGDPEDAEGSEGSEEFGHFEDAGEARGTAEEAAAGEIAEEATAAAATEAAPDCSPLPLQESGAEESGTEKSGTEESGAEESCSGEPRSHDSGDLAPVEERRDAGMGPDDADTESDAGIDDAEHEDDVEDPAEPGNRLESADYLGVADHLESADHVEIAPVGTQDDAADEETMTAVPAVEGEPLPEPPPQAGHEVVAQTGPDEWLTETAPAPRFPTQPGMAVDDGPEAGELADADDFWSAVLHDETERDWLDGPGRPRRLEETRPYGRPGGLAEADPDGQVSLAQAVSGRFPDPRGTWIRLINAEGPTEDAFRSNNAVDCALSVMSTWHGEPVVAARRQPEYDGSGRPLLTGETGGVARAEEWLGHRFEYVGHGRRAYVAIAQRLIFGGHGAAAVLITRWAGGGSHAWNAVNCRGEVLWIDAQRGHMAVEPPYEDVTGVFAVVIDRQGRRL